MTGWTGKRGRKLKSKLEKTKQKVGVCQFLYVCGVCDILKALVSVENNCVFSFLTLQSQKSGIEVGDNSGICFEYVLLETNLS